jgi:hypothetical protein
MHAPYRKLSPIDDDSMEVHESEEKPMALTQAGGISMEATLVSFTSISELIPLMTLVVLSVVYTATM